MFDLQIKKQLDYICKRQARKNECWAVFYIWSLSLITDSDAY